MMPWLVWTHAKMASLRGGRRILVAIGLGVLATAALPPIHAWPVLVPAFTGLVWLTDRRIAGKRACFLLGWCFGLGFFVAGLYWIFNAFEVRGGAFVWAGPFAVLLLSAVLALFPAFACLVARMVRTTGIGAVLVLSASWIAFEWLRGWAFTGFPWNLIGTAWTFSDSMIQATAVFGTLGLGLFTVIAAAMPSVLTDRTLPRRLAITAVVGSSAVLLIIWGSGLARLALVGDPGVVDGVVLRLVQPNISQKEKWQRNLLDTHLSQQIDLGTRAGSPAPTHVFWAEAAAPLFLAEDPARREAIGRGTPEDGLSVVGTLRRSAPEWPYTLHNSLLALDPDGAIVDEYDKVHLVPFGEYMPLQDVLGLDKLTEGTISYTPGPRRRTLHLPGLPPVGPLICYEVIFPGAVTADDERPEWLLNLTNDAWYGFSSGPFQHFAAARLRAVEEGLPVVRIAGTGISAIIDPLGRVVAQLGLERAGVVDGPLPRPLNPPTLYARFGDWIVLPMLVLTLTAGVWIGRRRRI